MNVLYVFSIVLAGAAALAVVLTTDLLRMAMLANFYTLTLVIFFLLLQAPDVALSELVVGTIAYPVVLVVAILIDRAE
jgi:energy-converting hydrogenase B subunit D